MASGRVPKTSKIFFIRLLSATDKIDKFPDSPAAAATAADEIYSGPDFRHGIGRAAGETAPADAVQIVQVISDISHFFLSGIQLPGDFLQKGQLVLDTLVQPGDFQLLSPVGYDLRIPPGDDHGGS